MTEVFGIFFGRSDYLNFVTYTCIDTVSWQTWHVKALTAKRENEFKVKVGIRKPRKYSTRIPDGILNVRYVRLRLWTLHQHGQVEMTWCMFFFKHIVEVRIGGAECCFYIDSIDVVFYDSPINS